MRKSTTFVLLLIALFFVTIIAEAQQQRFTPRSRYGSVGVSFNAINYFGDIVPQPDFTSLRLGSTRPSVGINYTYRIAPRISGRGSFTWGRIVGDDMRSASLDEAENEGRFRRNLSFRNDIKELSAVAIIDLFEHRGRFVNRRNFVPYGFVGIAVFHHNPKAYYENGSHPGIAVADDIPTGWYELQPLGTEGQYAAGESYPSPYSRVQIAIPLGLGARYKLGTNWDLSFEISLRKTFTDYLDDVSTAYADKDDILAGGGRNPRAAAILSDRSAESGFAFEPDPNGTPYNRVPGYGTFQNKMRGNDSDDDWYIITGLSINYIIAPRVRSPEFR